MDCGRVIDEEISERLHSSPAAEEYLIRPRKRDERVSVVELARDVLGDRLRYEDSGELFLREEGNWRPNTRLWHVMQAANAILKRRDEPQILHNPAWEVV